jgi:hypothetical protein
MEPKNKSTVNNSTVPQTSKQKAQKSQSGGPTIGGVAGIGKPKNPTRSQSAQATKTPSPTGVKTSIPHLGEHATSGIGTSVVGEGRNSEFAANQQLASTVRQKVAHKLSISGGRPQPRPNHQPGGGLSDYYAHNAKKTMKEDTVNEMGGGGGGAGGAPAMSVASGQAVPSITDPTTNYALQKKMREKMARRKKVK